MWIFVVLLLAVASTFASRSVGESPGFSSDDDSVYVEVARRVPGFGGTYTDLDGTHHVWLTQPSVEGVLAVHSILEELLGAEFIGGIWLPKQADYDFAQLKSWHEQLKNVLLIDGAVYSDIDESANRLALGVENPEAAKQAILAQVHQHSIPDEAIVIEEASPITTTATVRDTHRPLMGGLKIQFTAGILGVGQGTCTLGVIVNRSGVDGFITASHCSQTQGSADGSRYWQPTRPPVGNAGQIGTETVDSAYSGLYADCPTGKVCRESDANFVAKESGVAVSRGYIARPPLGSINWDGSTFRITKGTTPTTGTVTKVGETTGRTDGPILRTCRDTIVKDTNIVLLCQDVVGAGVDLGDSGSPVFRITHSPSPNDVELVGILWGKNDAGTEFVYSRYGKVKSEVGGSLTTCAPGFC